MGKSETCSFCRPRGSRVKYFPHFFLQQLIWVKTHCDFLSKTVISGIPEVVSLFAWVFLKVCWGVQKTQKGLAGWGVGNDLSTEESFCSSLIVICSRMYCFSSLNELQKLITSSLEAFKRDKYTKSFCWLEKVKVMTRPVHNCETKSFKPLSNCTGHNTHPDSVTVFPSQCPCCSFWFSSLTE